MCHFTMYKKLAIAELEFLKNLYKVDWPKYLPTVTLFECFIERFKKHPEWQDKAIFLTVNEESLKCGTFLMIYCNYIVNLNSLEAPSYTNLEKLVNDLDYSAEKKFWAMELHHVSVVGKVMKLQNLEKTADVGSDCGVISYQPGAIASLMEKFARPQQGFYYDSLKLSDIPELLATTPYNYLAWYFENVIKYNVTVGLYTNDGKLVASIVLNEGGDSGMLNVNANYRRKKIASGVLVRLGAKLLEMGKNNFGHITVGNEASIRVHKGVGDVEKIGSHRWITLRKNRKCATKSQL